MSGITMYDSVDISQIPANAQAAAGYVNGRFANSAELADRFPRAHILTIAVTADADADCLDIETGDATPADAAGWYERQRRRGITRPCLYASAFVMDTEVIPALTARGIARSAVRLWSAHYGAGEHICSPTSCKELSIGADACQWTDRAMGRNLDQSLLLPDFFGTPKPPATGWTAAMIADLPTLIQGSADKAGGVQMVHRMQALVKVVGDINKLPAASAVAATGTYDRTTWVGVLTVQKFFGLTEDGKVGPATWTALVAGQHG